MIQCLPGFYLQTDNMKFILGLVLWSHFLLVNFLTSLNRAIKTATYTQGRWLTEYSTIYSQMTIVIYYFYTKTHKNVFSAPILCSKPSLQLTMGTRHVSQSTQLSVVVSCQCTGQWSDNWESKPAQLELQHNSVMHVGEKLFKEGSACATLPPLSLGEPSCPSTAPQPLGQGCRNPAEPVTKTWCFMNLWCITTKRKFASRA